MENRKIRLRLKNFLLFIICVILLVIIRLIFLQVFHKDFKNNVIKFNNQYTREIKAKRGSIFTSDNLEIALDLEYQNFVIDPSLLKDKKEVRLFIDILSKHIEGIDKEKIISEILEKQKLGKKYYQFDNLITNKQKEALQKEINKEKKNNGFFKSRFIYFNKLYERKYVDNSVYETIVGYLNNEKKGVYGLEHRYDEYLKGINGLSTGTRPFANNLAEYSLPYLIDEKILEEKLDGNDIYLTINSILQQALDDVLKDAYEEYLPASAMGIIMEADTGKILAMNSYPKANDNSQVKNRNITDLFEPGSIFKPITVAASMNEKKINENTLFYSEGYIRVKDRIVRDHDGSTKGYLTVDEIITKSGNVGMVKIAETLEPDVFYNYLEKFGLGEKTGIDLSFEMNARLMGLKNFTQVRRANVSFGQGINMTQLQTIVSLNATINGGKILIPYVVDKILDSKGNLIIQNSPRVKYEVISEEASKKIRTILEHAVDKGTGKGVRLKGYRIGGKTGTAQKAGPRGYEKGKYFSSFYTFLPADKPKYSILITLDEPKGAYYGAAVALPVARKMLDKVIKYNQILPNIDVEIENKEIKDFKVNKNNLISDINESLKNSIMPDLQGITKKNLLNLDFKLYQLKINGKGKVIKQNILPGTVLNENDLIELYLE